MSDNRGRNKTKRFELFSKDGLFINQDIAETCISFSGKLLLEPDSQLLEFAKDSWQALVDEIRVSFPNVHVVYYYIKGDAVKIGITNNPRRRFREFETSSDRVGIPALCIPFVDKIFAYDFEQLVHKAFSKYRRNGEWFDLFVDSEHHEKENHVEELVGGLARKLEESKREHK